MLYGIDSLLVKKISVRYLCQIICPMESSNKSLLCFEECCASSKAWLFKMSRYIYDKNRLNNG